MPILVSYAYLKSAPTEVVDWLYGASEAGDIELLLDSGAFTATNAGATISITDYISFLKANKGRFFGYIQLDVIGDPAQSSVNLQRMLDAGLSPLPVHVRGDDEQRMDELFELSEWVALGGFRRPGRGPAPKPYIKEKMKWAKGRRVHWLGYTNPTMVASFKPYSVDCSSWAYGGMYGWLYLYNGNGSWARIHRKDKSKHRLTPRQMNTLSVCGFSASDFYDDKQWERPVRGELPGNEFILYMVNAFSWVMFARDIRVRFGTRLFLVICPIKNQMDTLKQSIEMIRRGVRV